MNAPRRRALLRWPPALALAMAQVQAHALAQGLAQAGPAAGPAQAPPADDDAVSPQRRLRFPRDHGAHLGAAIEWWYVTGWLADAAATGRGAASPIMPTTPTAPTAAAHPPGGGPGGSAVVPRFGFQITFFRSRTPVADLAPALSAGRFAPRHLLFAHAAVTDLGARRHRHAQRIARWSGEPAWPEAHARLDDTGLALGAWRLARTPLGPNGYTPSATATATTTATANAAAAAATANASRYTATVPAPEAGLHLALQLDSTQPRLLQGAAGHSRKGPRPEQASHYYTQPQLAAHATLTLDGRPQALQGRAWLDHEWSHHLLDPAPGPDTAVGWDWLGINLHDGGALTAFQLRRADGSTLWTGGSHRAATGAAGTATATDPAPTPWGDGALRFQPLRVWTSPDTGARYPVAWRIDTPLGRFTLEALLDAQEMDSRASVGAVYWEGLAELRDARGVAVGLGYLEMTGRLGALRLVR